MEGKMHLRPPIRVKQTRCFVCGAESNSKDHVLHALEFDELEGGPIICAQCVFEKLTGTRVPLHAAFRDLVR